MSTIPDTRHGDAVFRAAAAIIAGRTTPGGEDAFVKLRERKGDTITRLIVRSATSPTMATGNTALAPRIVIDYLANLAPLSAGGALVDRCVNMALGLDGNYGVSVPNFNPSQVSGGFVAEGQPIPVEQFSVTGPMLNPKKLAVISGLTQEMAASGNAEALIRQVMTESTALTLDAALFSASAETAAAPAGLLFGITATPAATGGGEAAFRSDMAALIGALGTGVRGDVMLFANPVTATKMRLYAGKDRLPFDIVPTEALLVGTVMAVGVAGLVFAADTDPKIDVSAESVLHYEDETPQPFSLPGGTNVVSAPIRSMYQTAQLAIRLILNVNWAFRASKSAAVINGATW